MKRHQIVDMNFSIKKIIRLCMITSLIESAKMGDHPALKAPFRSSTTTEHPRLSVIATTISVVAEVDDTGDETTQPGTPPEDNSSPSSTKADTKPSASSPKPGENPGDNSDDITEPTASPKVDTIKPNSGEDLTKEKTSSTSSTPIIIGVILGIVVIGAIGVVWYMRSKKGEHTNVEEAAEGKRYSQVPVNDAAIPLDDGTSSVPQQHNIN